MFELIETKCDERIRGPDDDTQGLVSKYSDAPGAVPRLPRADRCGNKRARKSNGYLDYGSDHKAPGQN